MYLYLSNAYNTKTFLFPVWNNAYPLSTLIALGFPHKILNELHLWDFYSSFHQMLICKGSNNNNQYFNQIYMYMNFFDHFWSMKNWHFSNEFNRKFFITVTVISEQGKQKSLTCDQLFKKSYFWGWGKLKWNCKNKNYYFNCTDQKSQILHILYNVINRKFRVWSPVKT